jgi:hypothetical protein
MDYLDGARTYVWILESDMAFQLEDNNEYVGMLPSNFYERDWSEWDMMVIDSVFYANGR